MPETCGNRPLPCSTWLTPFSRASRTCAPVSWNVTTVLSKASTRKASPRVIGPSLIEPRMFPPLIIAVSVRAYSRVASAIRFPRLVSRERTLPRSPSRDTTARPLPAAPPRPAPPPPQPMGPHQDRRRIVHRLHRPAPGRGQHPIEPFDVAAEDDMDLGDGLRQRQVLRIGHVRQGD